MNPVLFFVELIRHKLILDQAEFEQFVNDLKAQFDSSTSKFATFFKNPLVIAGLAIFLPVVKAWFEKGLNAIMPDKDGDGDTDINDLLIALAEKLQAKKLPQNG